MKKIILALAFLFLGIISGPAALGAEEDDIPDLGITETKPGQKVDRESADIHLKRANDFFILEALEKAEEEYQLALKANPGSAAAHFGLGHCQEMKNDVRGAIKEYLAAKRLDPKYFDASVRLADIYVSMGILDKAIQEYRSALEIDPRYSQGLIKIGLVYRKQGMLAEGAEAFRAALEIDPDSKLAVFNYASCEKDRGDIKGACEELDRLQGRVKNPDTKSLVNKILLDLCTSQ